MGAYPVKMCKRPKQQQLNGWEGGTPTFRPLGVSHGVKFVFKRQYAAHVAYCVACIFRMLVPKKYEVFLGN